MNKIDIIFNEIFSEYEMSKTTKISFSEIFSEYDPRLAMWCDKTTDTKEIALMADAILHKNIRIISALPDAIPILWTYIENNNALILARYMFDLQRADVSDISKQMTKICKTGASGIQFFVNMHDFENYMNILSDIRKKIFFNKHLSIGIDICDIDIHKLDYFFTKLREIQADSLVFKFGKDTEDKSDFVGRLYSILHAWNFDGELHFILMDRYNRIDEVINLVNIERPELNNKLHFFMEF